MFTTEAWLHEFFEAAAISTALWTMARSRRRRSRGRGGSTVISVRFAAGTAIDEMLAALNEAAKQTCQLN